jgi:MYXO-CTERM domain-containing protein
VRLVLPALVVMACSSGGQPVPSTAAGPESLSFEVAAAGNHVPRDLMVAIAQVEGGLMIPLRRSVEPDATVQVAGPLELRHGQLDTLARGAALMGRSELELRQDSELALEASARVLAEVGARTGGTEADLTTWGPAIEEMSGYSDAAHRTGYAHSVFALLARGGTFEGRDGEPITLPARDLPPSLTLTLDTSVHLDTGAEYPGAEWFPTSCTNKCDTTRGGNTVQFVVIHDTEGGWNASVATLQNDPGKSVHYIVGTDGHIGQFVPESYTAWHDGNYWSNQRSVGIEHVGYFTQPYPTVQYVESAKLVAYLTAKYSVVKDRAHIIGHDQVPNGSVLPQDAPACSASPATCETGTSYGGASNHRDPGDWEWCTYMPRFGGTCKCNDVSNLWTCSSDGTQAYRCAGGTVDLLTCDGTGGCVTMPKGQDDVCNQAPPKPDAGTPPGVDASSPPPSADASTPPPSGDQPPADGGGCSTGGNGPGSGAGMALLALSLLASRRRRTR